MKAATHAEVDIHIDASPETVYRLVSDITRMGEWSPETQRCQWIDDATGPEVGARFKAANRRGIVRWSNKPEVIAAEPGQEFAFRRTTVGSVVVWRYRMEPENSGTRLAESYEVVKPVPAFVSWIFNAAMRVRDRDADLTRGMRTTVERIRDAAEGEGSTG